MPKPPDVPEEIAIYWLSCPKFTVMVKTRNGVIEDTAPITKRFIGQRVSNLRIWAGKFGWVRMSEFGVE